MAKIKHKNMIIEVKPDISVGISAKVISSEGLSEREIELMNKNLEYVAELYRPKAGDYVLSASNAIATWLANGLKAEVIEYDKVEQEPNMIY